MKMGATYSSETLVNFQRTTRRYNCVTDYLCGLIIRRLNSETRHSMLLWAMFSHRWLWWVVLSGDITPCSPVKTNRLLKEVFCAHWEGRSLNQSWSRHQAELSLLRVLYAFLAWLTLLPWSWGRLCPPKCLLFLTGIFGVVSHNRGLFK